LPGPSSEVSFAWEMRWQVFLGETRIEEKYLNFLL